MHIPVFPFYWTLLNVLDEQSPMHGLDAARVIDADADPLNAILLNIRQNKTLYPKPPLSVIVFRAEDGYSSRAPEVITAASAGIGRRPTSRSAATGITAARK